MDEGQFSGDILQNEIQLVRAGSGQRLANYIIDVIVFYALIFGTAFLIAFTAPSLLEGLDTEDPGFNLLDRLISLVLYALYMSLVETIFKGRSLGKLITGTRAVNLDGTKITAATAFARGFSRAVPFSVFSALGSPCNPWQDRWTDTIVVDVKQSRLA